jgi:uncharacterized protein YndB with AHSA1/START domain
MILRLLVLAAIGLAPAAAAAQVISSSATHFRLESRVTVPATPAAVYAALGNVGSWWNLAHSYSGNAASLRLDPRAGGCFCEALPDGGSVEHGRILQARPGALLRLQTALGPLQGEAVTGVLTWTLRAAGTGTEIVQTYAVSGQVEGGVAALAAPVDGVMRDQLERLRAHLTPARP